MAASRATTHDKEGSTFVEIGRRVDAWSETTERWWKSLLARERIAVAFAAVFAVAGIMNLVASGLGGPRTAAAPSAPAAIVETQHATPALMREVAPADAGKTWSVVKVWQGSATRELESFTVGDHWRVDWLFSPVTANPQLQVYVYAADGRQLLTLAGNTSTSGPDSSFWLGQGTYFLRVHATGGAWKVAVAAPH